MWYGDVRRGTKVAVPWHIDFVASARDATELDVASSSQPVLSMVCLPPLVLSCVCYHAACRDISYCSRDFLYTDCGDSRWISHG